MKSNLHPSLLILAGVLSFAGGSMVWSGQEALVLDQPELDAAGNVHLSAAVGAATNVVFETSTNLGSWTTVAGSTWTDGILKLIQPVKDRARFYRLHRQAGGSTPLAIKVDVDELRRMSSVITAGGGEVSVSDAFGTRYTLTLPTNAVLEPVVVRMTVVTNLSGLPFSDTKPSGILLEPEGMQFPTPGRLTVEYLRRQPGTNATSFWLSGDGHELGLLPDQIISNRVEMAVYHFSTYGVANAIVSEIQAQTQQTSPDGFGNLEQQIANELRPLRDDGRLPMPGTPPPEPIGSRIKSLLQDYIRQHLDQAFLAGLITCDGTLKGMIEVGQVQALARGYGFDVGDLGLLPHRSLICQGLKKCAEDDLVRCHQGDAQAYTEVVRREAYAAALGFDCAKTSPDMFTNCLPKYYGPLKMLLREKNVDSVNSMDTQTLDICRREVKFDGMAVKVTEGFIFPPFLNLNLTITFEGLITISEQRTSLHHGLDGCEASPSGGNCGVHVRDREESGTLRSNITVTVTLTRTSDTTLKVDSPTQLWLPLKGYSWNYDNDACTCKELLDEHNNLESLLQVAVGGAYPDARIEQTSDTLYAEWLIGSVLCNENVNEAWIMDLKRRPGS